jgi:asparagine synthase (glutamine-hydrolysing)
LIATTAKEDGIKVLLSGEGADEFFGGYDRIFNWAREENIFDIETFCSLYCYKKIGLSERLLEKMINVFREVTEYSCFEKVRWFFIKYHLPILFRRLDFALMAAGVEGREPIANMHLFDYCKLMTAEDLMDKNIGKIPLRRLLEKEMGLEFSYAEKVGFPVDLREIFGNSDGKSSYDIWFDKNIEVLQ